MENATNCVYFGDIVYLIFLIRLTGSLMRNKCKVVEFSLYIIGGYTVYHGRQEMEFRVDMW